VADKFQASDVVFTLDSVLRDIAAARAYNKWLFSRAEARLGERVLDAGAGVGTFTAMAAARGKSVVAVEPEAAFAEYLQRTFAGNERVTVVRGTVKAVGDRDFDSIICFNVLEHIDDDDRTLRAFRERLIPGGRLFLLVPAHESLYGGYDRAAGHVRRYSKRRLEDVLSRAGFEIETLRHVNPVGALGWFVRVRLRSSSEWPSGSFAAFDRLVPLLRPLDALPLPFGLSLWAVGRRSDASAAAQPEDAEEERSQHRL
jgi:SAM-dependent methyltransferase